MGVEALERPLLKPISEEYAAARLLKTQVEARLALEFLDHLLGTPRGGHSKPRGRY